MHLSIEWMNEWMKSYIAHVSSRRLFRALYIESNLARPVIIQIPTQSPGRYTAELPLRRIKLFFIPSEFALCAKYSHIVDFLGSRWMETAPTSIEILLRPTLGQSDEPSDLRGSLSPTSVYSTWQSPGGHPSNYEPGATSPNFSDRANHDERTPYSVWPWMLFWRLLTPLLRLLTASYHHLMPLRHPSMPPDRLLMPFGRPLMPPHRPLICNCHLLRHLSHFNVFSWPFMRLHGASRPFLLRLKTFSSQYNASL